MHVRDALKIYRDGLGANDRKMLMEFLSLTPEERDEFLMHSLQHSMMALEDAAGVVVESRDLAKEDGPKDH